MSIEPPNYPGRLRYRILLLTMMTTPMVGVAFAFALDDVSQPPPGDPSAYTGPSIGLDMAIDYLASLLPANEGALEGGNPEINGFLTPDQLRSGGGYDIPTGSPPSPLFGAQPFEQQLLLFEEFGPEPLVNAQTGTLTFPEPEVGPAPEQDPDDIFSSSPPGQLLEDFLAEHGLDNSPSEYSNNINTNPWELLVEAFLGRDLLAPPAEGRPPGKGWAHQRWNEFYPEAYFKSAQAGARENHGFRDAHQRHGYAVGEFGPGGLYHTVYTSSVAGAPTLEGTTEGLRIRIHPNMPVQDHKSVWTFDGTLPPKLLQARYGEPILFRHYNALPIDPSANKGFGLHTISTHEHNGHNPSESDGFANAFFFPGQYYDYRWPMQLAGYDTVNTTASDPRASMPCEPGEMVFVNDGNQDFKECDADGHIQIRGDWRETMSTHWFHDHMLDFTAQNVFKGNAAMMNYYSAIDRGNEEWDDGVNLRFPSGSALSWGNRDYDVNLVVGDKAWDATGQLWFNIFNTDGFVGDQLLTNWLYKPYLNVRARRYRFRILNGSVSRYVSIALVKEVQGSGGEYPGPSGSGVSYDRVGFYLIANDGNIMEHSVAFDGTEDLDHDGNFDEHKGALPTQAIAERFDIVVDFASQNLVPGDKLYFVNTTEHKNGRLPNGKVPLEDILSESYHPVATETEWIGGDPAVGKFMEFRVVEYDGVDQSMDPADYTEGKLQMIPLPIDRNDPALQTSRHRTFDFGRSSGTDESPWTIKTDGGAGLNADPRRVSAAPQLATNPTEAGSDAVNADGYDSLGTLETWEIRGNGGWSHPVHVHFEEGVILSRDGGPPADWEWWARKDVYRIGPEEDGSHNVEMAIRFREFAGSYVEHCHNTQHEDKSMLLRWDIEHPGQVEMMPTPIPTWDGVEYVDSHALPTFRTGNGTGTTWEVPTSNASGVGGNTGNSPPGTIEVDFTANEGNLEPLVGKEPFEPDLTDIVVDRDMAIALGKALFWDTQVGSDGVACASCHFNAGADPRITHQVNPGPDNIFGGLPADHPVSAVNELLDAGDFPLHLLDDIEDRNSDILADADDRISSQGSFGGLLQDIGEDNDDSEMEHRVGHAGNHDHQDTWGASESTMCIPSTSGPYYHNGMAFRKVEPRNTPSVINAVYNFRNFWDGRASSIFNGTDPFGDATNDAEATSGVLIVEDRAKRRDPWRARLEQLSLPYSSLASQALGPPLSSFEMACEGTNFSMIARNLLNSKALADQEVASNDSVFGPAGLVSHGHDGLTLTYKQMIERAFHRKYWQSTDKYVVSDNGTVSVSSRSGYLQEEENFPLFFGIAIQMYESTLVSDDSAFDRGELTEQELAGQEVFQIDGMCSDCHSGALLSNAAIYTNPFGEVAMEPSGRAMVERMIMGDSAAAAYDVGFYNIGVRPTYEDLGVGASDPWGNPLSFARTYFSSNRTAVDGSFKVPSLRNVGLTAPYFHHGGMSNLEEVIEFYDRGGDNRGEFDVGDTTGYGDNLSNLDLFIQPIGLTDAQKNDLLAFLLTLTDYRVACHEAPFDHPALPITNGSTGIDADHDGYADDVWVTIPAVGEDGLGGINKSCMANTGDIFGATQDSFNDLISSSDEDEDQGHH